MTSCAHCGPPFPQLTHSWRQSPYTLRAHGQNLPSYSAPLDYTLQGCLSWLLPIHRKPASLRTASYLSTLYDSSNTIKLRLDLCPPVISLLLTLYTFYYIPSISLMPHYKTTIFNLLICQFRILIERNAYRLQVRNFFRQSHIYKIKTAT